MLIYVHTREGILAEEDTGVGVIVRVHMGGGILARRYHSWKTGRVVSKRVLLSDLILGDFPIQKPEKSRKSARRCQL